MMTKEEKICTECGGKCCKEAAGSYMPEDLLPITVEHLTELFRLDSYSVDWWEGDPSGGELDQVLYVRPRHVGKGLVDPSWGGRCVHLSDTGCTLSRMDRPFGCFELKPVAGGDCIQVVGTKRGTAIAWIPYQDVVLAAMREASGG